MKKKVAYRTKEKWGVQNELWFKKKMDNNWALIKKLGRSKKKIDYLGYKENKCSITKIRYFRMIPPKFIMIDRVYKIQAFTFIINVL